VAGGGASAPGLGCLSKFVQDKRVATGKDA